jgi:biopolymer transport protein ExbD
MARTIKHKKSANMQPPMTPMIDVVFQLLIFFLLTPSQTAGEGYLTTNLPSTSGPSQAAQTDVQRIKIELEAVGTDGRNVNIILNDSQDFGTNFEGLQAALEGLRAQGLPPDHPVLISPWMGTRHKWVVKAFDAAVAARFSNIHFAVPYD